MQFKEWLGLKKKGTANITTSLSGQETKAKNKATTVSANVNNNKINSSELPKESVPKSVFAAMRRMKSNDTLHADKKGWYIRVSEYFKHKNLLF